MARLRQYRHARAVTAEFAPRRCLGPRTLVAALAVALSLFAPANAQQDGDCAAPGDLEARAEQLSAQWNDSALRKALGLFERASVCWGRAGLRREEAGALKRI